MKQKEKKILLFGGTTEGREIACYLEENKISSFVSVASDYGRQILPVMEFCKVVKGRMDAVEMEHFIRENEIWLVVDATHPYAVEVSENIRAAVAETGVFYVRIIREQNERIQDGKYFSDIRALTDYLDTTKGNVLVTTGSKELGDFCAVKDFKKRIYARVLPVEAVVKQCLEMGFDKAHIITGQGPFSQEENEECLKKIHGTILVTKDTGAAGGFPQKIAAARKAGAEILILSRPESVEESKEGMTVKEFLYENCVRACFAGGD